jgi:hypothetical protein
MFLIALGAFAEEAKFTMSAPGIVNIGEQFSLTLSLNTSGDDLRMPEIENFDVLMGPSVSSSRSIQIINGKTSQSVNYSYTFILRGNKEGTFTISPATIKADREVVQSNSVKIQVIQGRNQGSSSQGGGNGGQQSASSADPSSRDNLFIRFETDKISVYKGEMIITTFKLYSRVNLSVIDQTLPSFEGFWTQDIDIPSADQTREQEAVDGIIYNVYTLQKKVLIPQQTGALTIEPAEMVFNVQQRVRSQSIFDDFFGSVQNVKVSAKSERVRINVKELPGAPAGFTGAVGKFSLSSSIDKTAIKANEAITINVKIDGTGNLKHINPFKFNFPPDFEVYDPKTSYNYKASGAGLSGSTSFEQVFIPRYAGRFTIPAQEFVYFDTDSKSYKTLRTDEFQINVSKGDDDQNTTVVSSVSKNDVKYIGKDIRYIKNDLSLKLKNSTFFGSFGFYLIYILALIAFGVLFFFRQKLMAENANIALSKTKKASKMARKHLKAASVCLTNNNKDEFFDALLRAFWGYLSDKLTLPMSELNRDTARETLKKFNVDDGTIDEFMALVDTCEMARFAPAAVHDSITELYAKAEIVIAEFEKQIRKKA